MLPMLVPFCWISSVVPAVAGTWAQPSEPAKSAGRVTVRGNTIWAMSAPLPCVSGMNISGS